MKQTHILVQLYIYFQTTAIFKSNQTYENKVHIKPVSIVSTELTSATQNSGQLGCDTVNNNRDHQVIEHISILNNSTIN